MPKRKAQLGVIVEKERRRGRSIVVRTTPIVNNFQLSDQGSSHVLPPDAGVIPSHIIDEPLTDGQEATAHYLRKDDLQKQWASVMNDVDIEFVLRKGNPSLPFCPNCGTSLSEEEEEEEEGSACLVQCSECFNIEMCTECAAALHEHLPLHEMIVWNKDGTCTPFAFNRVIKSMHICPLGYKQDEELEILDERGKIFKCRVEFCSCTSLHLRLVGLGFWPSSPTKPSRAYHEGFLLTLLYLMLEGHLSLQASCRSFMWKNDWSQKMMESIYRQLSDECFEEYRHFHHRMRTIEGLCQEASCPACPKVGGTTFISMDANFGLVRKKNAGQSVNGPKHGDTLFIDDKEVQSFVNEYSSDNGKSVSDCNNFLAGEAVRSRNKAIQLDKTGVFGAICRHGFPFKFLNMEHGERYGYPVLILKKIQEILAETEGNVTVAYDIACKLKAHLQKTKQTDILETFELVLPCWHAYGHNAACQVTFSTRWVENCGLTDGEEMERLWAYLRPFSTISKEMTPAHRIDLLTDALIHYGRRKFKDIVDVINQRHERAQLIRMQAMADLQSLLPENHSEELIRTWKDEEKVRLKRQNKSDSKLPWEEEYVSKLLSYHHSRDQLAGTEDDQMFDIINQHCESLNREIQCMERTNVVEERWTEVCHQFKSALKQLELKQKTALIKKLRHDVAEYQFMQETMRKHGGGQSISGRIAIQLGKTSKAVDSTIARYNKNQFKTDYLLPRQIMRKDALNADHDMYFVQEERTSDVNQLGEKRKAVMLLNMAQRAEEEMRFVDADKRSILLFCEDKIKKLRLTTANNRYESGINVMKREKIDQYRSLINQV